MLKLKNENKAVEVQPQQNKNTFRRYHQPYKEKTPEEMCPIIIHSNSNRLDNFSQRCSMTKQESSSKEEVKKPVPPVISPLLLIANACSNKENVSPREEAEYKEAALSLMKLKEAKKQIKDAQRQEKNKKRVDPCYGES